MERTFTIEDRTYRVRDVPGSKCEWNVEPVAPIPGAKWSKVRVGVDVVVANGEHVVGKVLVPRHGHWQSAAVLPFCAAENVDGAAHEMWGMAANTLCQTKVTHEAACEAMTMALVTTVVSADAHAPPEQYPHPESGALGRVRARPKKPPTEEKTMSSEPVTISDDLAKKLRELDVYFATTTSASPVRANMRGILTAFGQLAAEATGDDEVKKRVASINEKIRNASD